MKEIIRIAFDSAKYNNDSTFELDGQAFHVRQFGVEYNIELAIELIEKYKSECDAFAITGFPFDIKLKKKTYSHKFIARIKKAADGVPIFDGSFLRKAAIPWSLKKYLEQENHLLTNKKIGFYTGIVQWNIISFLEEYSPNLVFADLFFSSGLPVLINGVSSLEQFLKISGPFLMKMDLKEKVIRDFNSREANSRGMKRFQEADIFFVYESQLSFLKLNNLTGKTVIVDRVSAENQEKIFKAGAARIINLFPGGLQPTDIESTAIIEAAIGIKNNNRSISEEDILGTITKLNFSPKEILNSYNDIRSERFAFIIHPLSKNQITQIPGMEFLKNSNLVNTVESFAGKLPGFHYCKITGIKSIATGKTVEGDLFLLPSTPKMLLQNPVEKVYDSLVEICNKAHQRKAKIIGLGAYTKIVGDAGVTVNKRSPIPLTTGNSLSSASTLWAAAFGLEKMGLVKKESQIYQGTCMVIGATGSIGKVCAKILSRQWKRVIIVAPRPYKVLELVEHLKEFSPGSEIIGTTNPNKYSSEADLIITSTSAQGEKVLEIEMIKPGCVICDVSRPFDISLDDAAKRPDILIIASGEVELPGEVNISKTIGLQGDTVYACLAETALLALEGLHESFSLSRELSYEKVIQIDRLARKHGIRLSGIMGHTGEIQELEIEVCRKNALKVLDKKRQAQSPGPIF